MIDGRKLREWAIEYLEAEANLADIQTQVQAIQDRLQDRRCRVMERMITLGLRRMVAAGKLFEIIDVRSGADRTSQALVTHDLPLDLDQND